MIRSDYAMASTPLPGPLRLPPAYPFAGRARELATLRALLPRDSRRGTAGGARRRRAGLRARAGSCGSSRSSSPARARPCSTGTATPSSARRTARSRGARPSSSGPATRRRSRSATHLGARRCELTRLLPELGTRVGRLPAPRRPTRTPSGTGCTRRSPSCSTASRPRRRCCSCSRTSTGRTRRRCSSCVISSASGAAARMLLVATFRDTEAEVAAGARGGTRRRLPHRRRGARSGSAASRTPRWPSSSGWRPAPSRRAELTAVVGELTGGNAFLLTELWRELVDAGACPSGPSGVRLIRPASELGTPTTVREVVEPAPRSASRPATIELLELAAVVGAELRARRPSGRAAVLEEAALLDAIDEAVHGGLVVGAPGPWARVPLRARARSARGRRTALGLPHGRDPPPRRPRARAGRRAADADGGARRARLPLRGGCAVGGPRACRGGEPARGRVGPQRARVRRGEPPVPGRTGARSRGSRRARGRPPAPRRRAPPGRGRGGGAARVPRGGGARARRSPTTSCSPERRSGSRRRAGGRRSTTPAPSSCWRRRSCAPRRRLRAPRARARRPRPRARRSAAIRTAAPRPARPRSRCPAGSGTSRASRRRSPPRSGRAGRATNEQSTRCCSSRWRSGASSRTSSSRATRSRGSSRPAVALCDHDAARDGSSRLLETARRLSEPFLLHVTEQYSSALDLCDGDLEAAEAAAMRSHEWGRLLTGRDASGTYGIQMFGLRREQGRLAELAPVVSLLGSSARDGAWRPGLVAVLAELGMASEARRELDRLLDDGIGTLRPSLWVAALVYLTDACAVAARRALAETLYRELDDARGRERDDRSPRRLLRRDGPVPRDERRGPRRLGACGGALRGGPRPQHAARRADVARAHGLRVRAHAARARGGAATVARAGAARRGGRTGADDRAADARSRGRGAARGRRARRAAPGRAQPA